MYIILFRLKGGVMPPWSLIPNALYHTRARALQDAVSFAKYNEDRVYQVFTLSPVKG